VLGVPADIHRVGWWRDSRTPGSPHGAILIAGHRDSARAGTGAFFPLERARAGLQVGVQTADGRIRHYRITSVRSYPKNELPTSIFAAGGRNRLVLVTCGGPFDRTTGHYLRNIVVTATPTR
jgi:LPXTG-site transpeptidase (sortase) family protein